MTSITNCGHIKTNLPFDRDPRLSPPPPPARSPDWERSSWSPVGPSLHPGSGSSRCFQLKTEF